MIYIFIAIWASMFIWAAYAFNKPINIWVKTTFFNWRKVRLTDHKKFGRDARITVTKDGKFAPFSPLFPGKMCYRLEENGEFSFIELGFSSGTWSYV
jgi:hypothetical protein